jgi:hypothetical protein
MYKNYINYLANNSSEKISDFNFKSSRSYFGIVETVSSDIGNKYLNLILSEYKNLVNITDIIDYCNINDSIGNPKLTNYNDNLKCSPTSLRYFYHALLILSHINNTECDNIVEIGGGYGGLCLAINFLLKYFDVNIKNYNIIDLTEPIDLIEKYLNSNKSYISTNNIYHNSSSFGSNIKDNNLFMISNYCYTEIDKEFNNIYNNILLPNINNGFLVWQNGGNGGIYPVKDAKDILNKNILKICDERPQTDSGEGIYKNYFVYF